MNSRTGWMHIDLRLVGQLIAVGPFGGVTYHGLVTCSGGLVPFGAPNQPHFIVTPLLATTRTCTVWEACYNGLHGFSGAGEPVNTSKVWFSVEAWRNVRPCL